MAKNSNVSMDDGSGMTGWVGLAGFLMVLAGSFHAVAGLFALFKPTIFLTGENNTFVLDYTQWGWVHILVGVILVLSAMSLFAGKWWGRFVAITLATLSAIANFSFIWAHPVWSIMIIILDVVIIYAVAMYGGNAREE